MRPFLIAMSVLMLLRKPIVTEFKCILSDCCFYPCKADNCAHYDGTPDNFFYQELRRPMTAAAGERSPVVTVGGFR